MFAFGALTLLVGHHEEHPAWCGYLSYLWGAVNLVMVQLMQLPAHIVLHYIRQVNRVKLGGYTVFIFVCLSVCVRALSPIGLNGRNDILFTEKCIRLVCEKLTLFLYGQDIVGNVVLLVFWWYSRVQDRSGVFGEMYKNVTLISRKMDLLALPQHAVQQWRHGIGQQRVIHSSLLCCQFTWRI